MTHTLPRRLKAARALGGFDSQKALADELAMPRLSERNVRKVEEGKRGLEEHEVAAIARACGVSPAFFEVDFAALDAPSITRAAEATQVELLEAALALARAGAQGGREPDGQDRQGQGGGGPR